MTEQKISIIIPAYHEGDRLAANVARLRQAPGVEIVAALAIGDDETIRPESGPNVKVEIAPKGRANQMNQGAMASTGSILLFLHADTIIDPDSFNDVRRLMKDPMTALGHYSFALDGNGLRLRLVEVMTNFRSRLARLPYGDQAYFMRRELFERVGGYAEIPLMEDVDLVDRLKVHGGVTEIAHPAVTSARMWRQWGVAKVTWINWTTLALYRLGADPGWLARRRSRG